MALLQIAEPGASPLPHQDRVVVGIDLGTTHSLVATVKSGLPHILADELGRVLLPSIVHYRRDGIETGYEAEARSVEDPSNTVISAKRLMGKGYGDLAALSHLPYHWVAANRPGQPLTFNTAAGDKTAPQVSADILAALKKRAEAHLGKALYGAVITVPAYFDENQRQATKTAAQLADLHVLRLLSEPTAAALAYGLDNRVNGVFVVYDLGGGTFDVSILRLSEGVFEVIASGGNTQLGGDDYDHRLYCHMLEKTSIGPLSANDARRLLKAAKHCKESLSRDPIHDLDVSLGNGDTLRLAISQDTFWDLTRTLTNQTIQVIKQTMRDAQLTPAQIDAVVLVGGATRMPQVQAAVAQYFGKTPLCSLDPDQVVALGAAQQASRLIQGGSGNDWLLVDVIPLSLGLETMGGLAEKLIPRNSPIPCSFAQEFTTFRDGQTAISIHIVQGERELVSDCRSLGRFELRGIPPMVAGAARVRVRFDVDADGLLTVTAEEVNSGARAEVQVRPSVGLNETEIATMLTTAIENARSDTLHRQLLEARVSAEQLLTTCYAALEEDGALLSPEERQALKTALATLQNLVDGGDEARLRLALQQCQEASNPLAARRMDKTIRQALKGKSVEAVLKP